MAGVGHEEQFSLPALSARYVIRQETFAGTNDGTEVQLRMIASGLGLGLAPRSVLRASASRDEIAIVDATDFAMQLDIWLIHLRELGNLGRAIERLTAMVADGFARYAVA
jgi:DNA-binding transcriptional LysR family regulator